MKRGLRAVAVAAVVAAFALWAALSWPEDRPAGYRIDPGRRVRLFVTRTDAIRGDGVKASLSLGLRISVDMQTDGAFSGEIVRAELTSRSEGRDDVVLATDDAVADPVTASPQDLARRVVLGAMVGAPVRGRMDAGHGVVELEGVDDAVRGAAGREPPDGVAVDDLRDAQVGIEGLAGATVLLEALRGAGLSGVPASLRAERAEIRRPLRVQVPGRGVAQVVLSGLVGEASDGSPVVNFAASLREGAVFRPPVDEPPAGLGPVDLEGISIDGFTLYDPDTRLPTKGRLTVIHPFGSGIELMRRTEFVMVVD